jgi:hypothetical protein
MTKTALAAFIVLLVSASLGALDKASPGAIPPAPGFQERGPANGMVELDRNGDGKVDYRVYYDGNGKVSREELDFDFDGTMDTFYYYAGGVLQRQEIDTNGDGKIDLWVYLLDGTYVQRYERDTDGDGKPDIVKTFGG